MSRIVSRGGADCKRSIRRRPCRSREPTPTAAPIDRSELRLTERMGTASFHARVITYAEPERPEAARPAR
jgi:hypothetical protein